MVLLLQNNKMHSALEVRIIDFIVFFLFLLIYKENNRIVTWDIGFADGSVTIVIFTKDAILD